MRDQTESLQSPLLGIFLHRYSAMVDTVRA